MKAPYTTELGALPTSYRQMLRADITPVRDAIRNLGRGPAVFVGSGGTMAVAQLATLLHEWRCRQPARACTALELLDLPQLAERGALLFTSSARHPDALRVLAEFRRSRFAPAVVVTHRSPADLETIAGAETNVVQLPRLAQPDGFLATGSILQITIALLRAYLEEAQLAEELPPSFPDDSPLRDEVLVLTAPSLAPVASDLEVRLVESGLGAVQVADYRNFAHGRHTGFARRIANTTVIALSDPRSERLASGTVDVLPANTDLRRWHSNAPWPRALIELLVRSMRLAGEEGRRIGVDVARPNVPTFGRRLYRLPLRDRLIIRRTGAIERKMIALGSGENGDLRKLYRTAGSNWLAFVQDARFQAIVLDYDGTVCQTSRRLHLPASEIQDVLRNLLERGLSLGVASGRGQSLVHDLRRWVPRKHWQQILVGLYNGAVRLRLDEQLEDLRSPTVWSSSVAEAIRNLPISEQLVVEERGAQVTLGPLDSVLHQSRLGALVATCLESSGISAQVVASGHSVDIISPETSKTSVANALADLTGEGVLAIGDQGQIGGNDHALLARDGLTLSVDRCSADPTRCWFAGNGERSGPELLARYLRAIRKRRGGFAITGLELT